MMKCRVLLSIAWLLGLQEIALADDPLSIRECSDSAPAISPDHQKTSETLIQSDSSHVKAIMSNSVAFGGVRYNIPNAYLPSFTQPSQKSDYAAFKLSILLPDFEPAATNITEFRKLGWQRQLTALFEHTSPVRPASDVLAQYLTGRHQDPIDYNEMTNGCKLYHDHYSIGQDLIICDNVTNPFLATCVYGRDIPFPSCNVIEDLQVGTRVDYTFSRAFMSQIDLIDTCVRATAHFLEVP